MGYPCISLVALGQPEQWFVAEEKGVLAQVDGELNPNDLILLIHTSGRGCAYLLLFKY